jgi:Family of unknown function (DUF6165)
MELAVPISAGELIDKITILQIKSERIGDVEKRANVLRELKALQDVWAAASVSAAKVDDLWQELKLVNQRLWDIEDQIRDHEKNGEFGNRFVELARAVYFENDIRAAVKKKLNLRLGSVLVEEKSYADYSSNRPAPVHK